MKGELDRRWSGITVGGWDQGWDEQVKGFWDVRAVTSPFRPERTGGVEALKSYIEALLGDDAWPPSRAAKQLADGIRRHGDRAGAIETPGLWPLFSELAARTLAASKHVRHVPPHTARGGERPKCTLMGSFEQMGPGGSIETQRQFWEQVAPVPISGTHIRASQRLCAISLIKRFSWACYFAKELGRGVSALRYSDTATVAAREWIEEARRSVAEFDPDEIRRKYESWSGQWIFQQPRDWEGKSPGTVDEEDPDRDPSPISEKVRGLLRRAHDSMAKKEPRPYYAVIVLDGDDMGRWLRGEKAPLLRQAYHEKVLRYFESLGDGAQKALENKRPLSPALHAAISGALSAFALQLVPEIVRRHKGELVYAGGDDVLALLPTSQALACLHQLRESFSGRGGSLDEHAIPRGWEVLDSDAGRSILSLMGHEASASAGLALAHYKADLRDVIQSARQAERDAKNAGRDALGIAVLKRSGERSLSVCPWAYVPVLNRFVTAFLGGASDRWTYQLRADEHILGALEEGAVESLLGRAVGRAERLTREILEQCLSPDSPDSSRTGASDNGAERRRAPELVVDLYRCLRDSWAARAAPSTSRDRPRSVIGEFIALLQTASFLARGREAGEG